MKQFFCLLLVLTTLQACKKDDKTDEVKAPPTFTFLNPFGTQAYQYGDTIRINGTIAAAYDMHGYNVKVYNYQTGMFVLNNGYHEHGALFTVSEFWKNTVTDTSVMKVSIDAAIDHEGSIATKEILVTCYPQQ